MRRYPLLLVAALAVFLVIGCYGEQTDEAAAEPAPPAEAETAIGRVTCRERLGGMLRFYYGNAA